MKAVLLLLMLTLCTAISADFGKPERYAKGKILEFPGLKPEFERALAESRGDGQR